MVSIGRSDGGTSSAEHLEAFRGALAGHAYVEAFPGCYVIGLLYEAERGEVLEELQRVAEDNDPDGIAILVSPAIESAGTYNGWLEPEIWVPINKRTTRLSKSHERPDDA
jgi:hypothetical protein